MKKLKFIYRMEIRFSSPVSNHYFALRCIPGDSSRQKIVLTEQNIYPADYLARTRDGFGNIRLDGCCQGPHETFGYTITGTAVTHGMEVHKEPLHPMYRYPSPYTRLTPEIVVFARKAEKLCTEQGKKRNLDKAVCVMGLLYQSFSYESGTTDIYTTAGEALKQGRGVCQDYAHIMTAVLRYMGIPARYVTGLMIGEGYTHAWIEVYTDGGWYGLDPTNNLHIDEYYIKLAHGRDYGDCVVDRGCFRGKAKQEQKIYVKVEEIKNDGNSGVNETAGR